MRVGQRDGERNIAVQLFVAEQVGRIKWALTNRQVINKT